MHILQERFFGGRNLKVLLLREPTLREQSSTGTLCGGRDLMLVDAERCSSKMVPKRPGPVCPANMDPVGSRNSSWLPSNPKRLVVAASLGFPTPSNFLTIGVSELFVYTSGSVRTRWPHWVP